MDYNACMESTMAFFGIFRLFLSFFSLLFSVAVYQLFNFRRYIKRWYIYKMVPFVLAKIAEAHKNFSICMAFNEIFEYSENWFNRMVVTTGLWTWTLQAVFFCNSFVFY